jgi:hypothetical protein
VLNLNPAQVAMRKIPQNISPSILMPGLEQSEKQQQIK